MDLFSYCYNLVYVLFFSVALSSCFTAYGVTKQKIFRQFGTLLLVYLFDAVAVALFSVLNMRHTPLVIYFFVLSLFTGVETAILAQSVRTMFQGRPSRILTLLPPAAVLCSVCGILLPGNLGWFLDMTAFSFTLLLLSLVYGLFLRQSRETAYFAAAAKYRQLMFLIGLFSALSILETAVYLAGAHVIIDRLIPTYKSHINFFCDILSLLLAAWLVYFSRKEQDAYLSRQVEDLLQQRMLEFQIREQERQKQVSAEQIDSFGKYYGLTERETEILRLLLDGKSNQEIGQLLYITTGTVKTHVHSIFSKLEVSRRGQLMSKFVNHRP